MLKVEKTVKGCVRSYDYYQNILSTVKVNLKSKASATWKLTILPSVFFSLSWPPKFMDIYLHK